MSEEVASRHQHLFPQGIVNHQASGENQKTAR